MWIDIEQNTEEWFELRKGLATSSNFNIIMAHAGKTEMIECTPIELVSGMFGKINKLEKISVIMWGDPAKKYALRLALERVTGVLIPSDVFVTKSMEDGLILEPQAIQAYEKETLTEVTNGGFYNGLVVRPESLIEAVGLMKPSVDRTKYTVGDSPDGLLQDNGCIEVKSVKYTTQYEQWQKGKYPTAYKWQIAGHILVGEKDYCDFVSYCPVMPENKQLYIYRVKKDLELQEKLILRLEEFETLINEIENNLRKK